MILGATIVGPHAGELLLPWVLAISKDHKIGDIASLVVPYPTLSEISKRAAGSYFHAGTVFRANAEAGQISRGVRIRRGTQSVADTGTLEISVVIPTLDAGETLSGTLGMLGGVMETIVVDGGSRDGTHDIAARHGARVVQAPQGARSSVGGWRCVGPM